MSSNFNIDKLGDDKYESWNWQMRSVLVHQDLWSIVNGAEKIPKLTQDNKETVTALKEKDEKTMASFVLAISARQLKHIKKCGSASEAWNMLQSIHCPKSPIHKVTLFHVLFFESFEKDIKLSYILELRKKIVEIPFFN